MSTYGLAAGNKINEDTLELVREVKKKLKEQMEKTKTVTESDVAFATFDVKSEKGFYKGDIEKIKKSEIDGDQNLNSCFDISAAYVYDVNNIQSILENERRKYDKDSKSYPKRKILGNSVENTISPLNQLSRNRNIRLMDLFHEIQSVREKDVLRADRMFYSEANQLVKYLEKYTLENAHDQVQAICLMHYKPESDEYLDDFVRKYRTFESAYSYLQNIVKKKKNKVQESGQRPSSSDQSRHNKPQSSDDGSTHSPGSSSNRPLYNSLQPGRGTHSHN